MNISAEESIRETYSRDASGLVMRPDMVARPYDLNDVLELLSYSTQTRTPITTVGAQTSTTGASLCDNGIILSLVALNKVLDLDVKGQIATVQPGIRIGELNEQLAPHGLFFAPDPTSENDCTIGGAIACNASGPRSFKYGATRAHVSGLTVAKIDGSIEKLHRPQQLKNTAGYWPLHDLVDWYIGSEGTLGIIVEAEIRLIKLPKVEVGLIIPFPSESDAVRFIADIDTNSGIHPRCVEYLDEESVLIATAATTEVGSPETSTAARVWVYVEEVSDTAGIHLDAWLATIERWQGCVDEVMVFEGANALRKARKIRHAVPATMFERAQQYKELGGRRVSTDWAVPVHHLGRALQIARRYAAEANVSSPVIYGHAGNGHPHCNFIGASARDVEKIEKVVERTLEDILSLGGTIAAEHGIGKLKKRWLGRQLTSTQLGMLAAIKRELDPFGLLAPGNLI